MRTQKFRFWDSKINKYRNRGTISIAANGNVFILGIENKDYNIEFLDDIIVEQFTGLTDKNGKEIYEGDIVRPLNGGNAVVKIGFAEDMTINGQEYGVDFYGVYLDIPQTDTEDRTWYAHWEVIGNIHQNPELITSNPAR